MSTTRDYGRGPYIREQDQYPAQPGPYATSYDTDLYPGSGVRPDSGVYPDEGSEVWGDNRNTAVSDQPVRQRSKTVDDWMDGKSKFGGSGFKRKTAALILLGAWGFLPLFFMLPSVFTFNTHTIGNSVDDTLGTGAMMNLFLCLLVTPAVTITGQRWFVPLRRWYGIMFACCGIGDALGAAFFDDFGGNPFDKLVEHSFTLVGFIMVLLAIPLFITSNNWAQRKMGRYWKMLQRLTYVIWGLLFIHLATLEGFGFERGSNGSGFAGDGDPIFHQRLYEYCAASLFLLTVRLPPVKRWILARQQEGRGRLVYFVVAPIFALFVFSFIFIINELIFKGTHSFVENPSSE
jgi:DMSO/TMAO reductase YedYZ heme-binding membrane subunit